MYSVNYRAVYLLKKYYGKTASSAEIKELFHLAKIRQLIQVMPEVLSFDLPIPIENYQLIPLLSIRQ
jgi:hypothetical protein